jgi:hypothetical protein
MADIRDIALSKKNNENDKMDAQKPIALFSTKKKHNSKYTSSQV